MGRSIARGTELLTAMLIILTALVLPLFAAARQPGDVPRIAYVGFNHPTSGSEPTPFLDAFRDGLRERGWVEGHTIAIEWRWAEGSLERFATLVTDLVRLPVEVLVVPNATTAGIAKQATSTIPIVVVRGGGLLETGLVASLARPGGNITGVHTRAQEIIAKQLELLKQAVPGVTRVGVLGGPSWPRLPPLEEVARSLEMELHFFQVRESSAFDSTFAAMTTTHVHALLVLGDPFFDSHLAHIGALAAQHQLPSICLARWYVAGGCLMSYGVNFLDVGQRIAVYVDKILRGATPADLPVEQPMRFEFVINLKTAQTLGLTLAPQFLFQADEVIR